MHYPEPIDQERYAVQSLLELQNFNDHIERSFDWNNPQKYDKKPKLSSTSSNFVQINKKVNPQNLDENNAINRERLLNLQRFRRVRSLFDPMKIFKMGNRQLVYNQHQNPQYNQKSKQIIHKNPNQVYDLNFKSGHPNRSTFFKKDDLNLTSFSDMKHKSNEFINGESVIIQVQSYEQNFNHKEVEYLMSKTLGARNFKSQINFQKKDDGLGISMLEIKSQDMRLKKDNNRELKQINKNGNNCKMTSRMRFTAYVNKKRSQIATRQKGPEQTQSLDLKRTKVNKEIAMSLRLLLNNLRSKTYSQPKKSQNLSLQMAQYQYHNGVSNIFDKERIFKNYEQEEFKKQKNKRETKGKHHRELFRSSEPEKLIKHESQKISSKVYEENDLIRVSSPRRYYQQKNTTKNPEERQTRIFNIKKIA